MNKAHNFYEKLSNGENVKIIVIGDSIAWGSCASCSEKAWIYMLCQRLTQKYGSKVDFVNLSVGGTASYFGYHKLMSYQGFEKFDAAIICNGLNDAEKDFDIYYESVLRNVLIKYPKCEIFCTIESAHHDYNAKVKTIEKLASYYGCGVIDTIKSFAESGHKYEELIIDGTHPNDAGHEVYCETAMAVISKGVLSNKQPAKLCDSINKNVIRFDTYHFIPRNRMSLIDGKYSFVISGQIIGLDCIESPNGSSYKVYINGKIVRESTFQHEFDWEWERVYLLSEDNLNICSVSVELPVEADNKNFLGIIESGF